MRVNLRPQSMISHLISLSHHYFRFSFLRPVNRRGCGGEDLMEAEEEVAVVWKPAFLINFALMKREIIILDWSWPFLVICNYYSYLSRRLTAKQLHCGIRMNYLTFPMTNIYLIYIYFEVVMLLIFKHGRKVDCKRLNKVLISLLQTHCSKSPLTKSNCLYFSSDIMCVIFHINKCP